MIEAFILFVVFWVLISILISLWKWFFAPFEQVGKYVSEGTLLPAEKTAEELHDEVMQVAAEDLGCSIEEFKALLEEELKESRKEKRMRPKLRIVD